MITPTLRAALLRRLGRRGGTPSGARPDAIRCQMPSKPSPRRYSTKPGGQQPKAARAEDPIPVPNTVATIPLWQRLGPLTRLGQAYARMQRRRPYATQLCSSLVIYFCADISAQRMSGKEYDATRTGRSLVIGSISSIPSYEWFLFLSRNFNYSSRLLSLAVKVGINQLCFTPIFNSYFFGMQSLLAGDSFEQIVERIRRTVPVSFVNSCKLWPAVTAFSFTFIPVEYRSVFAGVIAVGWQTYLSYLNRLAEEAAVGAGVMAVALGPRPECGNQGEKIESC